MRTTQRNRMITELVRTIFHYCKCKQELHRILKKICWLLQYIKQIFL